MPSQRVIDAVWEKGRRVPGYDPTQYRMDGGGRIIRRDEFNNQRSVYGWCLHYVRPLWEGGDQSLSNLTPMSCLNKMLSLAGLNRQVAITS
ncbi:MAG: hypothetical protein RMK52_00085 [Chitinophagales bacterium]|nr:hypothetical protein [Chitinophagales bacterium]MDW8392625.1 hypothetical protein [Chitinophagales bacterium]MDW8428605.1 hypothetical protein [Chitinophagales bacterium]